MSQNFQAGDFLIFQIESGYGLLRLLAVDETENGKIWHLAAFEDLFLNVEDVDAALENADNLTVNVPHIALTNRAFEATQTARMKNTELKKDDLKPLEDWRTKNGEVSDRSIRLMLGLR
jgi:hypothetical protein